MKKIKCLLLILLVFLVVNVKADNKCEKEELTRLKELAKKVEFDYDYKLVNEQVIFSITAINLDDDLKVMIVDDYYSDKYREFKNNSDHSNTIDGFKSGEKVSITIEGFVPNWCSGTRLLTKTIKLPYYNYFYDEDLCRGYEDFKYCKELIDTNITKETFDAQYVLFAESKEVNNNEENNLMNSIWKWVMIIASIIVALAIIAIIVLSIIKKVKKNRL